MAKLSVINRQAKREALVKKYAEKRKQLFAIIRDPKATDEARDEALRHHRPSARHVPQIRPRAQQAARDRDARRGSRHDQGELVGAKS